jgi:hypothetical protein
MSMPPIGDPLPPPGTPSHDRDLGVYEHIEGLVGEEEALLSIPPEERKPHHHHRLREIESVLDRLHEAVQRRAHKRQGG